MLSHEIEPWFRVRQDLIRRIKGLFLINRGGMGKKKKSPLCSGYVIGQKHEDSSSLKRNIISATIDMRLFAVSPGIELEAKGLN